MQLTEQTIRRAKVPGKGRATITDGMGLQLRVTQLGIKSWSLQYRHNGKMLKMTFGRYPDISLKNARILAAEARLQIAKGIDPQEPKRTYKSFEVVAVANCFDEFIKRHLSNLRTGGITYTRTLIAGER